MQQSNSIHRVLAPITRKVILLAIGLCGPLFCLSSSAQNAQTDKTAAQNTAASDASLLDAFVRSRNNGMSIMFDAKNIKQFWINNSVVSRKDFFDIILAETKDKTFESIPLKIQLANVNESLDCKVDVIADSSDFVFSVFSKSNLLSSSSSEENFINYSVKSASFHLAETPGMSFNLVFKSNTANTIAIRRVILSFSKNKSNIIKYTKDNLVVKPNEPSVAPENASGLVVTGKKSYLSASEDIAVSDNTVLRNSVTIKNIGDEPTRVFIGYALFNEEKTRIHGGHYPYKSTKKVLTVVSSEDNSDTIYVDSYDNWTKRCFLALDAKEDLSDVPNFSFADGLITDFINDDNGTRIVLDKPLKTGLKKGTKVRIHGLSGDFYYTHKKVLQPGEEETFISSTMRDNNNLDYVAKNFPRGTSYVVPIILSYSLSSDKDNTILISGFTILY